MPSCLQSRRPRPRQAPLPAPAHPGSAAEDPSQEQTIRSIHHTLYGNPRHQHLPPRSLLRLAQHALAAQHSTIPQQEASLTHWARQHGHLIQHLPAAFQPPPNTEDSQMEHHVWPHTSGHRVLKLTHAGHFGMWPHAVGLGWDMHTRDATPARYLARLQAANLHLQDDWVLHAIVTDPHGHIQLLTSQPHYQGITPGDIIASAPESRQPQLRLQQQTLIHRALAAQGFHPTTHTPSTFYRPTDNLAMLDAHLDNLMWLDTPHGHLLMPFDVILMHPQGKLRQNITASSLTPFVSSLIPCNTTTKHL